MDKHDRCMSIKEAVVVRVFVFRGGGGGGILFC